MAGRYSGCYVRTTVSGDTSDHTLASDTYLHTCRAGPRGLIIIRFALGRYEQGGAPLYLGLLGNLQGVIDFDAQVSDRTLKLSMA